MVKRVFLREDLEDIFLNSNTGMLNILMTCHSGVRECFESKYHPSHNRWIMFW